MDTSCIEECNKATVGGVIRNIKGTIGITSMRPTGDIPFLVVECMPIGKGVRLTRTRKVRNIEVESDEIQFVKVINGEMQCPLLTLTFDSRDFGREEKL